MVAPLPLIDQIFNLKALLLIRHVAVIITCILINLTWIILAAKICLTDSPNELIMRDF